MNRRRSALLARGLWMVTLLLGAASIALQIKAGGVTVGDWLDSLLAAVALVGSSTVGLLIITRRPGNTLGWIFLGVGAFWSLSGLASEYASFAVSTGRTSVLLAEIADWSGQWSWMPPTFLAPALIALLFPDGRPLTPRWRPVVWAAVLCTIVIVAGTALGPGPMEDPLFLKQNPFGIQGAGSLMNALVGSAWLPMLVVLVASIASLVIRLRRARGEEREQMKWLAFGVGLAVATVGAGSIMSASSGASSKTVLGTIVIGANLLTLAFIPVAAGIAILKYRLYHIDLVINRTVVFGTLAAFITIVYVAIVVGVGALFGRGNNPNVALSIVATAIVAVAFQPVRAAVQRFANRLVYGERAEPYEVMAGFAHAMAGTLSVDAALPEMAEAAARGVGATHSRVRLFLAAGEERRVTWPADDARDEEHAFSRTMEVTHGGKAVGEIAVAKPPGEPLTPGEDRLLADLAQQAGLALHNVALTFELQDRVLQISAQAEELRRSRQRLVTARDAQRRSLERDIRDGAQHQLLQIERKLGEATLAVENRPDEANGILDALEADANTALEGLRDLARGIFPPLLADEGILAALEAHLRKVAVPATIELDPPELEEARFDPDTEAAVYFCCVQALQNVARHANGAPASVSIIRADGWLEFTVADDGPGFDPASAARGMGFQIMTDRVEALGGTLSIASAPREGVRVTGRIPAREEATIG